MGETPHRTNRHRPKIFLNPNVLAYSKSPWTKTNMYTWLYGWNMRRPWKKVPFKIALCETEISFPSKITVFVCTFKRIEKNPPPPPLLHPLRFGERETDHVSEKLPLCQYWVCRPPWLRQHNVNMSITLKGLPGFHKLHFRYLFPCSLLNCWY